MPTLTPAEFAALQSQHPLVASVKWYLALAPYGDPTFTALVNDVGIAKGEREITYIGDVGELTVQPGMTLWVGTGAGLYDVGKVRIRSINTVTNTITVAENDDIAWADGLFLTCPGEAGFRELWGVYSRIDEVAGVVTFYEDYDLVFAANPDDIIPPKANAGPPVCAFLNDDGWVDVEFYDDGESFTTEIAPAAIDSWDWDFADGIIQVGAANQPGTCAVPNVVRFNSAGFRYVSLTVTDNTARNRPGVVHVPVWILPRKGSGAPLNVEVIDQSGDPHWQFRLKVFESEATAQDVFYNYPNGALCVVFTETEYPDGSSDVGGFCHRTNVRFVGWLDAETLSFGYDAGTVEFTANGHDLRLMQLPGFAYTLEDAAPTDWWQVGDLNLDRALHVHLERRTTVNQVCHVERLGEGAARPIAIQPFPDASPYVQAQEHLLKDAMATLIADRQGIFRVRRDPQFMNSAARDLVDVVCTLTATDILNAVDESKSHQLELGYVRLGGFSYETPLLAQAPGVAPGQSEVATYTEGFIVVNQLELNLWAGLWYKRENNPYKSVPIELSGYWPVFDPAFQEYVRLTLTDPLGRNPLTDQRFIVREVTFRDSPVDGTTITELILEMETVILYGEFVEVPAPPPPEEPPSPPPIVIIPVDPPEFALTHDRWRIYSTPDFQANPPVWTNITGLVNGVIRAAEVDQYDRKGAWALTGTDGVGSGDNGVGVGLWRTNDVTVPAPVWALVFSQNDGDINREWWDCGTGDSEPNWGQLRSVVSVAAGEAMIAEARWAGLTGNIRGASAMYRVDSVGGFVNANDQVTPPDNIKCTALMSWWCHVCGYCGENSNDHAGQSFHRISIICSEGAVDSCHQLLAPYGYRSEPYACGMIREIDAAGQYNWYCNDASQCWDAIGTCTRIATVPNNPSAAIAEYLDGATHMAHHKGEYWAQAIKSTIVAGVNGSVYGSRGGEVDQDLWVDGTFCNMCSHPEHIFWCKTDPLTPGVNILKRDNIDTPISSDLLFGSSGVGYNAGIIGHIRAIWDENRTIVLVRKDEPDALQPNGEVIWTWNDVDGLINKTGNLLGLWRGTGIDDVPNPWTDPWDNVGFSAFGVILR